jgi:oligopeptide/dipeptide ABC transporter ATP-binding protein
LQAKHQIAYLFISHDLRVVERMSHRVAVMYLGRIVELAAAADLYECPRHPYTRALLSAIPVPDPSRQRIHLKLTGELPSPLNPPTGCSFHPRCPRTERGVCDTLVPSLDPAPDDEGNHLVACFHPETT